MKSAFFLLLFGLAAYMAWDHFENATVVPAVVFHPPRAKVAAQAEPVPGPVAAPEAPNLASVAVGRGLLLTHAKVKDVTTTGVVFLCDQGLVKIPFDHLPAEFATFYTPKIVEEDVPSVPTVSPSPPPPVQRRVEKSAVQDAQDQLAFTRARMGLSDRIKGDEQVMDQWYQQSSFRNPTVAESTFVSAKADLNAATLQLAELEANGPGH